MLASDVAKHHPAANPAMEDLVREEAPVDAILLRILRNLDESYDRLHAMADRQLMRKLAMREAGLQFVFTASSSRRCDP